jgi:hypothetical protein
VLPKEPGSYRIPQVPLKEQEATKSPKCLQKNRKQQNPPSASKRRGSNKILQVPPKEQEATKSPTPA